MFKTGDKVFDSRFPAATEEIWRVSQDTAHFVSGGMAPLKYLKPAAEQPAMAQGQPVEPEPLTGRALQEATFDRNLPGVWRV